MVAERIAAAIRGTGTVGEFGGAGHCWLEAGGGLAGFTSGEFYAEPDPRVPLPYAGRMWHWSKVVFEQYWLGEGLRRAALRLGLKAGAAVSGVPAKL